MKVKFENKKNGFTLIESLIGIAIFLILAGIVYSTSTALIKQTRYYREYTTISGLADQYLEIARNLPYSQVGTLSGNPHGSLPDEPNAATTTLNGSNYAIYYVVNYIDDPADGTAIAGTDSAPNDYKQVKLYVKNSTTGVITNFLTNIVPKNLESLNNGGALSIKVFDAVGQPVPNATIDITNTSLTPHIDLTRTTDANGNWIEVGLPNSSNSYHIVASKTGYSTDQTYPVTSGNPTPIKTDSTISNGQVTQISFNIDKTSNLIFNTLSRTCAAISGVGLEVRGSKTIGLPNVLKFDNNYTSNSSGNISLNNIEWDTYIPALNTSSYMLYGTSPVLQNNLLPNTTQQFSLILGPKTANDLLVTVKDPVGNTVDGASVNLHSDTGPAYDNTKITSNSTLTDQDFSGGSGQSDFTDTTKYFQDDGHINTTDTPAGVRLLGSSPNYAPSGTLTSSTFDTGTASSSYSLISWNPTSQDPATSIKFQIATNNDNTTWNYLGPDGTSNTYYTVSGTKINAIHKNNQYIRYKVFLSTTDSTKTPVLTSVNIDYISGCFTPGQAIFPGLTTGTNYSATISADGYQTQTISGLNINGINALVVSMSP